jgi:branched-chain amino acid transport system substrate-binding protein
MLQIGFLMPRSTMFPSLGLDILNGFKENLKNQNLAGEIKLLTENIGFGIDEQEIYAKAEKMLLQEDADLVIVCADTIITEMLQPLFTASNKILIALNFGANFPDNWQPASTTITHSLNFCLHAGLTGKLAAVESGKEAANVLSYLDGGYRQCYMMLNSHQANGGVPRFNHITNHNQNEFTLAPLAGFLEQNNTVKTLVCLFAGDTAQQFYREVASLQKKENLNLYVSPMMLDESLKETMGEDFSIEKVRGFVPWHSSLHNGANKIFCKAIGASAGRPANYFFLLGWDAGLILSEIIKLGESGTTGATALTKALTETTFNSPRGWMKIDPATHYSYGPSYLAGCNNNLEISVAREAENIDEAWAALTKEKLASGENSSWRNTYLCV